jgi:DNA modification methylase
MRELVALFTEPSALVLDPFMGSGSTALGCIKTGRRFIGIERDETHFATACERIRKAYAQPDFFVETAKEPAPVQQPLFGEVS